MLKSTIKTGTPKWMLSFSYLMLLLLSFFILLLSFSEIDALKYKKLVLSLEHVFGLKQYYDNSDTLPHGASIVLQEYSVGNTTTVAVKAIVDNSNQTFQDLAQSQPMEKALNNLGASITQELRNEQASGALDIEINDDSITIRINEKYSFESGADEIKADLYPVLNKIATLLAQNPGNVIVAGFTDDVPVQNARFHDNWELSSLRAYQVLSVLLNNQNNAAERFVLIAHGSNRPLYVNNSIANRAKNRRVEITLKQPQARLVIRDNIKMLDTKGNPAPKNNINDPEKNPSEDDNS